MDNNDVKFDRLLTAALYRAAEIDYGDIPSDEELEQILHISPRYKSKMKLLFNKRKNAAQKQKRPIIAKIMQTAAVILVTFSILLGTLMAVSPTVRAMVVDFVRSWLEDRTEYYTPSQNFDPNKEWVFEYIPEGFELIDSYKTDLHLFNVYKNPEDTLLMIFISDGKQIIDNEHSIFSQSELENGNLIDIYESNDPDYPNNIVIFDASANLLITITSEVSIDELIKIAENIK